MRQSRLLIGSVLTACGLLAATGASGAMLTGVQGDVQVDQGRGFIAAAGVTVLALGDRIRIAKGSTAQIRYSDGCIFPPAEGSTIAVGAQSPCAIRASYPRPSYVGGAASLYTHAIHAPAKKRTSAKPSAHKLRQSSKSGSQRRAAWQPLGPQHQPLSISPPQSAPLQVEGPWEVTVDVSGQMPAQAAQDALAALPPIGPGPGPVPLPGPALIPAGTGLGTGLTTGMLVAGGVGVVGGAVLLVTSTQKRESKAAASP
jgi:hypothetical protein